MAAVNSTMQSLGSPAPNFSLIDVRTEQLVQLTNAQEQPVLLMFICNHCPFVLHIMDEMVSLANKAQRNGFFVAAISSNDISAYPQDGPEPMIEFAQQYKFEFPYLYDESQSVAKNYRAACTPDFFVYDSNHKLAYRGQMDDARPSNSLPVTGTDLHNALDAIVNGLLIPKKQTPSIGCNIKWIRGNEPDYFGSAKPLK